MSIQFVSYVRIFSRSSPRVSVHWIHKDVALLQWALNNSLEPPSTCASNSEDLLVVFFNPWFFTVCSCILYRLQLFRSYILNISLFACLSFPSENIYHCLYLIKKLGSYIWNVCLSFHFRSASGQWAQKHIFGFESFSPFIMNNRILIK